MAIGKEKPWKLEGYDTFSEEWYPLSGEYSDEKDAIDAATKQLEDLEKIQPTETSGGQKLSGIQDRIYIIRPDGTRYRFTGKALLF